MKGKKPTLRITNNSGDKFIFTYSSDEEAQKLFQSNIYKSGEELEYFPSSGYWHFVWNRKLNQTFECWGNTL